MNIIQMLLLIGLILVAISKGFAYSTIRNKPENERDISEFKKAKREFVWSVVTATIYACIKLM